MTKQRYLVVYERTPRNWSAYAPDVAGLGAVADTREEMEAQMQGALAFHFDCLVDEGKPIPLPTTTPRDGWDWGYVDVALPTTLARANQGMP